MSGQAVWHAMTKAQKIAYLRRYPLEERIALIDCLTFPRTGREITELIEAMYVRLRAREYHRKAS